MPSGQTRGCDGVAAVRPRLPWSRGILPNATRISMQTETRGRSPGGRYDNNQPFKVGFRSTEDPTSPERDGRLKLQGISVRTDVGHPAFSRPVGTQCHRTFVVPNLQKVGLL
jgi:hypothetical protein